jgi:septal ring factor EnvC (AmiA/AmiB activator)
MSAKRTKVTRRVTSDALELEGYLTSLLKSQINAPSSNRVEVFKSVFNEIIQRDKTYSNLLIKIKQAYEEQMRMPRGDSSDFKKLQQELREKKAELSRVTEEREAYQAKLKQLATENVTVTRVID